MRGLAAAVAFTSIALAPALASADADVAPSDAPITPHADERRFGYLVDPRTPSARSFVADYFLGVSSIDTDRPLPSAIGQSGVVHQLGLTYAATDRIAPFFSATAAQPARSGDSFAATGAFGVRFQLGALDSPFRAGVTATGYRELGGTLGASVRLAASYDFGRLRVAGNVLLQHAFDSNRDAIDYIAFAGFSYKIIDQLRLGAEWVGQDLEGAWSDEVEGGAKNYVGPTVAVDLDHSRVQLVFSPSYGIGPGAARVLGRASVIVGF
jgi:hypothetical protein